MPKIALISVFSNLHKNTLINATKTEQRSLQLSGDIVTNLQGQIDELRESVEGVNERIDFILSGMALVKLICKTEDGTLLKNLVIDNFLTLDGNTISAASDSNGVASGYIPAVDSHTLSISEKMLDVEQKSQELSNIVGGKTYVIDFIVTPRAFASISATGTYYQTNYYNSGSFSIVGGGGGGASGGGVWVTTNDTRWIKNTSGGGGGGGDVAYGETVPSSNPNIQIEIGAGGSGGRGASLSGDVFPSTNIASYPDKFGSPGGSTSVLGVVAVGGGGGGTKAKTTANLYDLREAGSSENGAGGTGSMQNSHSHLPTGGNGSAGTKSYYSDETTDSLCGGGGGGGSGITEYDYATNTYHYATGGSPKGGRGGHGMPNTSPVSAGGGKIPGGGGGGGSSLNTAKSYTGSPGGAGGKGIFTIRYSKIV